MDKASLEETWQQELDRWMEPFQPCLHHEHQRHWAPVYLRGLLGPGERKSTTCIAQQVAPGEQDQLNHFVAHSPWEVKPAQQVLIDKANALVGRAKAHLVVDDLGWLKKGEHSVGVAHPWCGAAGKKANCQVAVSLTLARGEVPAPIALRLYLPQSWGQDPPRRQQAAGCPRRAASPLVFNHGAPGVRAVLAAEGSKKGPWKAMAHRPSPACPRCGAGLLRMAG